MGNETETLPSFAPKPRHLPMAATAMDHDGGGDDDVVTPGELLGNTLTLVPGRGAYAEGRSVRVGHRPPPHRGARTWLRRPGKVYLFRFSNFFSWYV